MNEVDASKEEGEISEEDDVQLVGFSKSGEAYTNSDLPEFRNIRQYNDCQIRKQTRDANRPRVFNKSRIREGSGRRSGRGYGLSASLTSARERLKNNPVRTSIPKLMSLDTSHSSIFSSAMAGSCPLSVNNSALLASIPLPISPDPSSVATISIERSRNALLAKLKRNKPFRKTVMQKPQSALFESYASCASSDMEEIDYVDMLLEYKEIQKKLEVINQEEGRLVEEEKNKENLKEMTPNSSTKETTGPASQCNVDAASKQPTEEEDDLEILVLRHRCLESLAAVTEDKCPQRRNSSQKGRQRITSYRRNRSPIGRRPSFAGSRDLGPGLRSRRWLLPSPERPSQDHGQVFSRDRKRPREDLDSKEEFKKFVELRGQKSELTDSFKRKKAAAYLVSSAGDNYEEVEMDLDSSNEDLDTAVTGSSQKFEATVEENKESAGIADVDGSFVESSCSGLGRNAEVGYARSFPVFIQSDPAAIFPPSLKVTFPGAMPAADTSFGSLVAQTMATTPEVARESGFPLDLSRLNQPVVLPQGMNFGRLHPHPTPGGSAPLMLGIHGFYGKQDVAWTQPSSEIPPVAWAWNSQEMAKSPGKEFDVIPGSFPVAGNTSSSSSYLLGDETPRVVEGEISGLSDSSEETSTDSEEVLLRKLLLKDLAEKKNLLKDDKETVKDHVAIGEFLKPETKPLKEEKEVLQSQSSIEPSISRGQLCYLSLQNETKPPMLQHFFQQTKESQVRLNNSSSLSVTVSDRSVVSSSLTRPSHVPSEPTSFAPPSQLITRTVSAVSLPNAQSASSRALFPMNMPSMKITLHAPPAKAKTWVPMPQHKPVVISLSGDTDSDSAESDLEEDKRFMMSEEDQRTVISEDDKRTVVVPRLSSGTDLSASLLGNLDSLLKEARLATESSSSCLEFNEADTYPTPTTAVEQEAKITEQKLHLEPASGKTSSTDISKLLPPNEENRKSSFPKDSALKKQKSVRLAKLTTVAAPSTGTSVQTTLHAKLFNLGLGTWLTDCRKVELKLLARKIAQLEKEIKAERAHLQQEERHLASVELKMTRTKGQYRQSIIRVDKLKEQLSATEKIVKHNQQQVIILSKKTQELKGLMEKRKSRLEELKKEMKEAGRRLCSGEPLPKTNTLAKQVSTTSVKGTFVRKTSLASSKQPVCQDAANFVTSKTIAAEKKRLEELAKRFEELIELHKRKQAAKNSAKQLRVKATDGEKSEELECEHIETEEKMTFGIAMDTEKEITEFMPKRRKSVLDESPTTTKPIFGESVSSCKLRMQNTNAVMCTDVLGTSESDTRLENFSDQRFAAIKSITEGRLRQVRRVLNDHLSKQLGVFNFGLRCSDPFLQFQPPIEKVISLAEGSQKTSASEASSSFKPYHSSLLCFRSYRFSPYFRTKERQMVQSSSHKINVSLQLCHFDLMGKCNDDKCPWQHEDDYRTGHRETLIDIVSYGPSVAGVTEATPIDNYPQLIGQYVDEFVKQNSKLTESQQVLRLLMETYDRTGLAAPHCVLTEPRKWKLSSAFKSVADYSDEKEKFFFPVKDGTTNEVVNEDDIILDLDVRYWMLETQEAEDIETAVAENPSNIQLWLKLAYKKMSDSKRVKPEETLAIGLHVLSRALEANQNSETLWRHYLHLFGKREDNSELRNFYSVALNCAPSYYLYWKYLELSKSFLEKMDVCKRIRQFLCSPRCHEDPRKRSHHLLEIVLYQAGLNVETGRVRVGQEVIESVVKSRVSVIWLNMVWIDRIIVWLAYIHLVEFKRLPAALYDPADILPGRIVNKVPFSMPWSEKMKPRLSLIHLMKHADSAIQACGSCLNEDTENAVWLCELYRIKFYLEEEANGLEAALTLCHQTLQSLPQFENLWIVLTELTNRSAADQKQVHEVITDALKLNPTSISIHLTAISICLCQGDPEKALEFAERSSLSVFDVDIHDSAADPNLLFCKLLDQTLPCTYNAPAFVSGLSEEWVARHRADIWLCYCLLLDLQGAHEQASEAYHRAISTIRTSADLGTFCLQFLRRCYGVLRGELPWSSSSANTFNQSQLWSEFDGHISQVLRIIPSKFPLPHDPEVSWINYSMHNQVIDLYLKCLSDDESILKSYEKFLSLMPANVPLVQKACDFLLKKKGYNALCNGFCSAALYERPKAVQLWNIKLLLSHQDGNINQTRRTFRLATSSVPFVQNLWKDFMLFEIVQRNSESVLSIVQRCRELQINVEDALNAVCANIPKLKEAAH